MRLTRALVIPLGLIAGLLVRAMPPRAQTPAPLFTNGTQVAGLSGFRLVSGSLEKSYIVEAMGGGVCLLDYDRDGFLDIFFVNGGTIEKFRSGQPSGLRHALFRNLGDRTFREVTAEAGVPGNGAWGYGCSVADYDNDGWPDLYVTNFGPNLLYRNRGDGRFEELAGRAGVDDSRWSTGSAWADFNRDGWADLFVANYIALDPGNLPEPGSEEFGSMGRGRGCQYEGLPVMCGPRGLAGAGDTLYRNNGDGTFTDVSRSAGIEDANAYYGLGVVWGDFDQDGWPDLYVANDSTPNYLYRNRGDGTFEEMGFLSGTAVNGAGQEQAGMGVAVGDFENSGRTAIFVTNFADEMNTLYRNDGQMNFSDFSYQSALGPPSLPYVSWGTFFFDYDNDGWLDLFVVNGHVYPQVDALAGSRRYRQRNLLFRNLGNGRFEEMAAAHVPLEVAVGRGAVWGDLDNDGSLDIVITNLDDSPVLLWNRVQRRQNFLQLRLVGRESTRDAWGAGVRVRTGERWQLREVQSGGSYLSQSDTRLHVGLGEATQADEVQIRWPSGASSVLRDVPANQILTVEEPHREPAPRETPAKVPGEGRPAHPSKVAGRGPAE